MSSTPPPHSNDAEIAVLYSMIFNPNECIPIVLNILKEDCFYKESHRYIFAAITRLIEQDTEVNILTVVEELHKTNKLEDAGDVKYLVNLSSAYYPSSGAKAAAQIVFERYAKRCLRQTGQEQQQSADDPASDMFDVLEKTESVLEDLRAKIDSMKQTPTMFSLSRASFDKMMNQGEGEVVQNGVQSGFYDLDEITNGFGPGELIILAARPSMGKTALALNIARHAATEGAIGVFSLEMSASALYNRLLSAETGVPGADIKRNRLTDEDKAMLVAGHGRLSELPIILDETPGTTLLMLKAKAKRMKREHNVQMIIIDYLQLITPPKAGNREEQISIISRGLKIMAKELGIPVMALAQLNREVEKRSDKTPHLSDLRESGSLEQDADIVMFINRLEQYGVDNYEDGSETKDTAQIIVAKNREGETGTVKLVWQKYCTRFKNYEAWQH